MFLHLKVTDLSHRPPILIMYIWNDLTSILQLICREESVPGRADAALGTGGHIIPDTAWRRITIACPDIYVLMAFRKSPNRCCLLSINTLK